LKFAGEQTNLIREITKLGKPCILVSSTGRPVDLRYENECCNAIITNFLGGDYGGVAVVEAIIGRFSPSGRLPISYPMTVGHIPSYYSRLPGRSSYVYGGDNITGNNLFDFGFGLSYTRFEYSDLRITDCSSDGGISVKVEVTVKNVGEIDSYEVVQLYVDDVFSSVSTPVKQLKGYKKVFINKGERAGVEFFLDYDSFKLLDNEFKWVVEPGEFEIMIGSSCNDIKLRGIYNYLQT